MPYRAVVAVAKLYVTLSVVFAASSRHDASATKESGSDPWNPYPVRGELQFSIADYGAVGDNSTADTTAIQRTIDAAAAAVEVAGGPAYVWVPPGGYLIASLNLSSNVYLILEKGGVLQGSSQPADYAFDWEQWNVVQAWGVSNTGIIAPQEGEMGGELRGSMWQMIAGWNAKDHCFIQKNWHGVNNCSADCRPMNLLVVDSTNISIVSVRIMDSAFWTQTFRRCTNVLERGVHVEGATQYGNNDGLDIESCTNVTVEDSVFITGDDCIAMRSGHCQELNHPWPMDPHSGRFQPTNAIRLRNLSLQSTSAAIKVEALFQFNHGDLYDVEATNVTIQKTNRAIGIWQRNGNGTMRDLIFRNFDIETQLQYQPNFWGRGEPIVVTSIPDEPADCEHSPQCPPVNEVGLRGIRNITFEHFVARSEGAALFASYTGPASPSYRGRGAIDGVLLRNVSITITQVGNCTMQGGTHDFSPLSDGNSIVPAPVDGVFVDAATNVEFEDVTMSFVGQDQPGYNWSMQCVHISRRSIRPAGLAELRCHNTSSRLFSAGPAAVKHLFIDSSIVSNSTRVELVRHMPSTAMLKNEGRVLWPEHPWETYQGPGTYGGVMQDSDGQYRCYYLCRGNSIGDVKTCLATSTDGVTWTKPVLNLVEWNGSTANNIVLPTAWAATGSVFLDSNPATPPSQKYVFVGNAINPASPHAKGGSYAITSPDGFRDWQFMTRYPAINKSDTCNVGWWDMKQKAYVIYVRLDQEDKDTGAIRRIARTVTPRLDGPWGPRQDVFAADGHDPPNMDIYINSATRYAGVTLFFPSVYFHFSGATPQHPWNLTRCSPLGGATNDGLWDSRLVVSRDGMNLHYPGGPGTEARNARKPFAYQGNNRCSFGGSVKDLGGWCDPFDESYAHTSWDTSMVAFYPGYVESADGEKIYLYKWGTAATHHVQGHCPATWGNNSGISLMTLRTDGFVSVDSGYIFSADKERLPQFTTIPLGLPSCPQGQLIVLRVNVQTSVVGYLLVELREPLTGNVVAGHSLEDADALRGSFISHMFTWQHGHTIDVPSLNGSVIARVAMSDASLYSLTFACQE